GQVTRARVNNEVAAFTNGRAVAIQTPVAWTSGADTVKLNFTGPIRIDVSVWVVSGDYAQQHNLAIQMQLAATTIWENERMGVEFRAFDFHDATTNSAAANVSEFDQFGISCDGERQFMQTQIGKDADRINVYMVHTVKGDLGQAEACGFGTGFVVIGSAGGD